MERDVFQPNDEMFATAYAELRRHARVLTRRQRDTPTLDPTALVHEAYLRLAANRRFQAESPQHLTYTVVRAMRYVLIDAARRRTAAVRGGVMRRIPLDDSAAQVASFDPADLLSMNMALRALDEAHAPEARAFELQFFGGLAVAEIAATMALSEKKVQRLLRLARAFLSRTLAAADRVPGKARES
jgi:RNA polymerase sigma factor (TIGR02999 family)